MLRMRTQPPISSEYNSLISAVMFADAEHSRETAFTYLQSYVQSIPTSSTAAKTAGLELIVSALRLPNSVDTDSLLKLENVQALQGHPLHTLIQLFSRENLDEYRKWQGENEASLKEFGMSWSHPKGSIN